MASTDSIPSRKAPTLARGETSLKAFLARVRGPVLFPQDAGYDEVRQVWNAMIDRRPALILRASGVADAIEAVNFARESGMTLSVRGGGHNIAGTSVCDGGLMIDFSLLKGVRIDPVARTTHVQPGATLGDVDHETQVFGLAVPAGIVTTTGVAGLTLGGGFGWLSRRFGYTCDNLLSADLVTADGRFLRANRQENAELFWALRGGGGNFGIVTSFEYRLCQMGPEVIAGIVVHPMARAAEVVALFRTLSAAAPEELCYFLVLRHAPPASFLPAEIHGKPIAAIAACYSGAIERGLGALGPLKDFGRPIADTIGPKRFTAHQALFDSGQPKGAYYYWKSHYLRELGMKAAETLVEQAGRITSPQSAILVMQLGGAVARVGEAETAVAYRDAGYIVNIAGSWLEPSRQEAHIGWARGCWEALRPASMGSGYVNFLTADELASDDLRVRAAYGPNYARLTAIKSKWDPDNLFRSNQNIRPAA